MAIYLRTCGASAAALILGACAASGGNVKPMAAQSGAVSKNPPCVPHTGSRIGPNETDVISCYTRDDLAHTGLFNNAQALQMLDPTIRATH